MISSHHFLLVLLNDFKMNALFSSTFVSFNEAFMEGAILIGNDELSSVDERELMLVGIQVLILDFLWVEVLDNKLVLATVLTLLLQLLLQYYYHLMQSDFELLFDKLSQTLKELPSFV